MILTLPSILNAHELAQFRTTFARMLSLRRFSVTARTAASASERLNSSPGWRAAIATADARSNGSRARATSSAR